MIDSHKGIRSLDCIAICTVLGFTLGDTRIGKLCRRYDLYTGKDPLDTSYGFYLLHKSCHGGGMLPKRLTKLLDERFAGIIKVVRQTNSGNEVGCGNDEEIAAKLKSWIRKCPADVIWALLTDPRERFRQYGVYLVHQVSYAAFRDAQRKTTAVGEGDDAMAAAQRDLQLARNRFAQQKTEAEDLRKQLTEAERSMAALRATGERLEQRLAELEERPGRETRLRRRIRMLEHELGTQAQSSMSPGPAKTCGESNGKEDTGNQPFDLAAARSSWTDAVLQLADPTTPPGAGYSSCPLEDLRVAVIGGLERLEPRYRDVVESLGAQFFFHNGDCHGGCRILENVVCQSDIIVFITRVNSHAALRVVRGICRKSGRRFTVLRETSPQALTKVLGEVA